MEQMTVRDALVNIANDLGGIPVPRNMNMMIGVHIDRAILNIQRCVEALDARAAEQAEAQETEQPEEKALFPEGEDENDEADAE